MASFWNSVNQIEGLSIKKIKRKINNLAFHVSRCLKPFILRESYNLPLEMNKSNNKSFNIIGMDIMLDEDGEP